MAPKRTQTAEVGAPGLIQHSGYILEERDTRLKSRRTRMQTYGEMQNDPTIAAGLRGFDALARSIGDTLTPGPDTPPELVSFIEACFADMEDAWGDVLSEILTEITYGFSIFEIVYAVRPDGRIGWQRWAPRAQDTIERWIFDKDGRTVTAFEQVAPPDYRAVTVPMDRCIHFKTMRRKQNPEGVSLIRPAFEPESPPLIRRWAARISASSGEPSAKPPESIPTPGLGTSALPAKPLRSTLAR